MMNQSKWVWWTESPKPDEYAEFLDVFSAEKAQGAILKISVVGDYNVYVNGALAAFGQYADYPTKKVYDEVDLSAYLQDGENELRIVVWYVGEDFSTHRASGAGLFYELTSKDGEMYSYSKAGMRSRLATGYVSHLQKKITVQLGYSYEYDTREISTPYGEAVLATDYGKNLLPRPNQKLTLAPLKKATLIDEEKKLYDLGEESCGFLSIGFRAQDGARVKVLFGEHITDGEVRAYIGIRDFSVDFIGNGEQTEFLGSFRRLGCRYLQVVGDAEIEYIGLRETHYPLAVKPYKIENEHRRKIYETCLHTLQLCVHEHYEDCPWREQAMYILDSRNQMLCGYEAFDNKECALSAIRLMMQGQRESGLFDLCFPSEIPLTIPSFSLVFPTVVWEYATRNNGLELVEETLPKIEKMLRYFLARIDESGLFKTVPEDGIWHFYEWAGTLDGGFFKEGGISTGPGDYDVLINAFLSIALKTTAELFALVDKGADGEKYLLIRESLNKKMKEKFYVAESGLFKTYATGEEYSELANALCVLADVGTENENLYICDKLAYGGVEWTKSTLSMMAFRYDAMVKTDKEKYGEVILADIDKTYGYMLERGATTFWETILGESDFDNAGSLCHGWSAIPVYYYHLLGVVK